MTSEKLIINNWQFISESSYAGPRSFEVPYVLNRLKEGNTIEIGGNQSLFKWALVRRGKPFTLIDPMGTTFNNKQNHRLATCIKGDIRKYTSKDLGKFTNVLLVSVLEHIGLKAYGQPKDWVSSARLEQLKAFKHCMSFVKQDGQMLCTLPFTNNKEEKDPNFLLRYNKEMLNDLYKGYKLLDERFYILNQPTHLDRWKEVTLQETKDHRSNVCFTLCK
jgi:hypothetical protein